MATEAEAKKAVITEKDLKSGKRLRVHGLNGHYGKAHFDNDGVSTGLVDAETEDSLRRDYPNAKIEEVKEETGK